MLLPRSNDHHPSDSCLGDRSHPRCRSARVSGSFGGADEINLRSPVAFGHRQGRHASGPKPRPCVRGEPTGVCKLLAPIMASAMRRANRKDLTTLGRLLASR